MAEFAKCHICRALMVDDPDDRREHLGDHANTKRRLDALGRSNGQYLTEIAALRDQVKSYGQQLAQHPISMEPESISINEMPDDEIDEFEGDLNPSTYADEDVAATIANPTAGEPLEDAADYPLAIDRPERLDMYGNRVIG